MSGTSRLNYVLFAVYLSMPSISLITDEKFESIKSNFENVANAAFSEARVAQVCKVHFETILNILLVRFILWLYVCVQEISRNREKPWWLPVLLLLLAFFAYDDVIYYMKNPLSFIVMSILFGGVYFLHVKGLLTVAVGFVRRMLAARQLADS